MLVEAAAGAQPIPTAQSFLPSHPPSFGRRLRRFQRRLTRALPSSEKDALASAEPVQLAPAGKPITRAALLRTLRTHLRLYRLVRRAAAV
jgi:hypothetical protein